MVEWRPRGLRRPAHGAPLHRHARRLTLAWVAAACAVLGPFAGAAAAQPVNNTRPEVVGNALVGERLVCGAGSWTGPVQEFRYAWIRDGVHFASGVTYTVAAGDKGHTLWCAVTAGLSATHTAGAAIERTPASRAAEVRRTLARPLSR